MRMVLTVAVLAVLVALAAPAATQVQGPGQPDKPAPDIWIKHIDLSGGTFAPGARIRVALTVENRGTAVALGSARGGYMLDISLGVRPAGFPLTSHTLPAPYRFVEGMLLKGGRISRTDDLAPGASKVYVAEVELPKDIKVGTYWVQLGADSFNALIEPQPHPRGEHDNGNNVDITIVR